MTLFDFTSLIRLYRRMDTAYDTVAAQYGFQCTGCEDNCCTSLFFHHTFLEKAYLLHGFSQLKPDRQKEIRQAAADYVRRTFGGNDAAGGNRNTAEITSLKLLCPLNRQGRCELYGFRPMICRLHGLPHELHPPERHKIKGPGCHAGQFDVKPYIPFDRTPFYVKMAALEQRFKQQHDNSGRLKQTVAQMLTLQGTLH